MKRNTHTIDATGKILGRLASEVAGLLRGKHKPEFEPHMDMGDKVIIEHIDSIIVTGKKMEKELYRSHSGHPGGLKEMTMKKVKEQYGMGEIFKRTIFRMLPENKLRNNYMKRLLIK